MISIEPQTTLEGKHVHGRPSAVGRAPIPPLTNKIDVNFRRSAQTPETTTRRVGALPESAITRFRSAGANAS